MLKHITQLLKPIKNYQKINLGNCQLVILEGYIDSLVFGVYPLILEVHYDRLRFGLMNSLSVYLRSRVF